MDQIDPYLAIDAVAHQNRVVALVISVLYRGCAIPVAWHIVPAQAKGAWMPHILALLDVLAPAVPADWCTLVLVDCGLWSPDLWRHLRQRRLHTLLRLNDGIAVRPVGRKRTVTLAHLAPGPGRGWVGVADVYNGPWNLDSDAGGDRGDYRDENGLHSSRQSPGRTRAAQRAEEPLAACR